jgi:hypothetical protein
MAGALSRDTSRGQLVPLVFGQTDLAATQTDAQLVVAIAESAQANTGYVMPFDGNVVAVSWDFTAAPTAGTGTIGATINGTEDADTRSSITVDSATTTGRLRVQRGKAVFTAGQSIGVELTTDGSFAPITADLSVVVWVLLDVDGI